MAMGPGRAPLSLTRAILILCYDLWRRVAKDATITVRVSRRVKESLPSAALTRRGCEEGPRGGNRGKEAEELREIATRLGEFFAKIPDEEIVGSVRETRGSK